jgi:hypothetical protein
MVGCEGKSVLWINMEHFSNNRDVLLYCSVMFGMQGIEPHLKMSVQFHGMRCVHLHC